MPLEVLDQRAAGEDIDRLQATADAEDRYPRLERRAECLVLQRVALRFGGPGPGRWLAVAGGVDIGTAGEQQPIHGGHGLRPVGG